jgi:hypothetical protein
MSTQNPVWNNLLAGTPWGDLTIELPLYNPHQFSLDYMESIHSWGDLEESLPLIDPPEDLDEGEMPDLTEINDDTYVPLELNYAFLEEFHAAEPLEEPLIEENAPILETAATIPATEPLELLLLPPPAKRGEAAADISTAFHRKENP